MNWVFLNKKSQDQYIEMLAHGCGTASTKLETWDYHSSKNPLVLRGIMKHKIIKQCWQDGRPFLYMDSGYIGNRQSIQNPHGWKQWHRVVLNDLQHKDIVVRPPDRWLVHNIGMPARQHGSKIIVAAPDAKPCIFYGIDLDQWISTTVSTISKYTDRPVIVRSRDPNRQNRLTNDFQHSLKDVHAVVTYNSIAATESILAGIPAFVLAPVNAAIPVANTDLAQIDTPWWPDSDQIFAWACHLAYGQFHNQELQNGTAWQILKEQFNA